MSTAHGGSQLSQHSRVLQLQRQAGNRAVAGLLAPHSVPAPAVPPVQRQPVVGGVVTHTELRAGSHGEEVKQAQRKLSRVQASAAPLTEDGSFGPLTVAAVRTFQSSNGIAPANGVLTLATWTQLDTAFAALPPPVRQVLTLGMDHPDVGFAQQKLNAVGATPRLAVDGIYSNAMLGPVIAFEVLAMHRFPTTTIDAAFWTALDAAVAGGFNALEGASGTSVEQHTPSGTADSLGTQTPGTSLHPVVGGTGILKGTAVKELQQKLNTAGASPALKPDGKFGPKTTAALQAFQSSRTPPLTASGVADAATWAALDAASPGSTVGFVSRTWTEEVGGATYGLTSLYSWEIQSTRMLVTAKVNFTGLAPPASWFGFVPATWNMYKAVRTAPPKQMPIDFQMVRGSGQDASTVVVHPGNARANAGDWYVGDNQASRTIPHEYGHLIGLADEYQQHPGDYVKVTGREPPVGLTTGPVGQTPQTIAQALQNAMVARNSANAFNATSGAGVRSGAFAQRIVAAYAALPTVTVPAVPAALGPPPVPAQPAIPLTGNLVRDLESALPPDPPGTLNKYETIQVLTYSSGSIMGDPNRVKDTHDHGSQPRHVEQFVQILARSLGGVWRAERR